MSAVDDATRAFATDREAAREAWRAVCNGQGRVDSSTRKLLNAGQKAAGPGVYAPDLIAIGVAAAMERRAKRNGGAPVALVVDGVTFVRRE